MNKQQKIKSGRLFAPRLICFVIATYLQPQPPKLPKKPPPPLQQQQIKSNATGKQ